MNRFMIKVALAALILPVAKSWAGVAVTNLVSDDQSVNAAILTDTNLKNSWGVSYLPGGPFWVSDNGTGKSTIYSVNPTTNMPSTVSLVVAIPGDGSVTGQVANSTADFNGDLFLFVSEDGTVSGWRAVLGSTAENLALADANNVYKGAAFATIGGNSYLYAANFKSGNIDVYKGNAGAPSLLGTFTDPNIPSGYAPFNVQNLGGTLYVTYALADASGHDDVPGAGHGFVDSFDLNGNFLARVASQGALNSPWGLAIAPAGFENVGGDLLVGNFGDGTINAYNLATHVNDGPLKGLNNLPISIDGLWALTVGNGAQAGNTNLIYFTAGPTDESNGLIGSLASVPEPSALALILIAGFAMAGRRAFTRPLTTDDRQFPHSANSFLPTADA
jgi:uncharacterized protein (TIGR03118 family)